MADIGVITVRHVPFDLETDRPLDPVVIPGDPEMSYFMVAFSMILPYLEPYLVKHSVAGRKVIEDKELRDDMLLFSKQETQHWTSHAKFNDRVREMYPGFATLEERAKRDYARFSKRGLKFNLAFAEGFESLTGPFIIFMWESGMINDMKGALGDMYKWHFLEEMEHRTVAYDAYYHLYDGYFYRLYVSLIAQYHLLKFIWDGGCLMLREDRHRFQEFGGWSGRWRRSKKWLGFLGKYFIPQLWRTYLPGYNPRGLKLPPILPDLAKLYTERATKLEHAPAR